MPSRALRFVPVTTALLRRRTAAAILATLISVPALTAGHAVAASTLIWDPDTVTAGANGGTGTWDANTTANWWNGSADQTWTDVTGTDTAGFDTTAGTVTLSGTIVANALIFNIDGYALSGGTLVLAGSTPTITETTGTATIGSVINGTAGLTKAGAGTLILSAANGYTGTTTISGGTLALTGGNNRLATSGTVNFSGTGTLDVGSTSQTLAALTVADTNTGTVTGTGGTLILTGSTFRIGSSTGAQTLDLSPLGTFQYNNAAGTITVGGSGSAANPGFAGNLTLAGANSLTANVLTVGPATSLGSATPSSTRNTATLSLGQSNTINANTINVGLTFCDSTLKFQSTGLTSNPTLTIRNTAGTGRANMTVAQGGGAPGDISSVDLVTGVIGTSQLDALIGNLTIGLENRGSTTTASITPTGSFTMGSGTLDATNITLAQVNSGDNRGTVSGTFTTGAGTVKVGTLTLGNDLSSAGSPDSSVSGTFNLNGGGILSAQTITPGSNVGGGTRTRIFTWNDGTIKNYDASTDLIIASGLTTFSLAATGTHTFDIDSGRTGTVNQAISGTGALTKAGAGTLILNGSNTYAGATTVIAGTLGGTGTIKPGGSANISVSVNGVLAPGNGGIGTFVIDGSGSTAANILSLAAGAQFSFELNTGLQSDLISLVNGSANDILFGGNTINFSDLSSGNLGAGQYTLFTASIAGAYSGLTTDGNGFITSGLTIGTGLSAYPGSNLQVSGNNIVLNVVPEPGTATALIGGAAMLLGLRRRRSAC